MPQFGKFKIYVVVDGEALPEYSTTTDEATKTITCWIPSQEGKAFSVDFESDVYPATLIVPVKVDGEWIESGLIPPRGIPQTRRFAEFVTSPTTSRELLFSRIELTDDDAFLNTNVKGLGEISLSVWDGTLGEPYISSITKEVPKKKVHERSKKAMGHQVKFGEEKVTKPRNYFDFTTNELVATFIFKYRSIDILRADGIAPPDPTGNKRKANEDPEEDEAEDDDEDEDADVTDEEEDEKELKALLEKINTIQSKLAKKGSKKTKSKKKMKTEPRPLLISGEVIDLT